MVRRKLTVEELRERYRKHGAELLADKYEGAKKKYRFICSCGKAGEKTYDAFVLAPRCTKCKKKSSLSQYDLETARQHYKDRGMKFLDDYYVHQGHPHNIRCVCGTEIKMRLSDSRRGQHCKECGRKNSNKNGMKYKDFKDFSEEFVKRGAKLLDTEYTGVNKYYRYVCSCGRENRTIFSNFLKSPRCKVCASESMSGENHPLWRPELTEEDRQRGRNFPEYIEWRKKVFENFQYLCYLCGDESNTLHAHHIVPYSINRELRTEESNGILLCIDCHRDIHSSFKLENMNFEALKQYEEYHYPDFEKELDYDPEEGFYYAMV